MNASRVLYAVVAAGLLTACPSDPDGSNPPSSASSVDLVTSTPATATASRTVDVVGAEEANIALVAPGDEPRRTIGYTLAETQRKVTLAVRTSMPGAPAGQGTKIDIALDWLRRGKRFDWIVTSAEFAIAAGDAADPAPAGLEQIRAGFASQAGHAEMPASQHMVVRQTQGMRTTPAVGRLLHGFMVPFPARPIGVGAKWTATRADPSPGKTGTDVTHYELSALSARGATVRLRGTSSWKGANSSGSGRSEGEVLLLFSDILPQQGRLSTTETMNMPPLGSSPAEPVTAHVSVTLNAP